MRGEAGVGSAGRVADPAAQVPEDSVQPVRDPGHARQVDVASIQISRTTYTQIHDGRAVPTNARALQPGDLVFTEGSAARPEHVAMTIGHGLLVHAPRPGRVIEVAKVAMHGIHLVARRIV
ncbi:NlpC/P60 family protein [Streptomyces sp. NPDC097610]|uniref:NlpC/P60 family protein n=1 Tax=Streptomyces sp. NPDC097610 TaxID=3157227 RepID=UPI00332BC473